MCFRLHCWACVLCLGWWLCPCCTIMRYNFVVGLCFARYLLWVVEVLDCQVFVYFESYMVIAFISWIGFVRY